VRLFSFEQRRIGKGRLTGTLLIRAGALAMMWDTVTLMWEVGKRRIRWFLTAFLPTNK
jgi:hypothetical protein